TIWQRESHAVELIAAELTVIGTFVLHCVASTRALVAAVASGVASDVRRAVVGKHPALAEHADRGSPTRTGRGRSHQGAAIAVEEVHAGRVAVGALHRNRVRTDTVQRDVLAAPLGEAAAEVGDSIAPADLCPFSVVVARRWLRRARPTFCRAGDLLAEARVRATVVLGAALRSCIGRDHDP